MEYPCLFLGGVALLVVMLLWKVLTRGTITVGKYDFLEVLSVHVWKTIPQIREEMQQRFRGHLPLARLCFVLTDLEDEDLIENRIIEDSQRLEFRLTSGGIRKRDESHTVPTSPVLAAQLTLGGFSCGEWAIYFRLVVPHRQLLKHQNGFDYFFSSIR